MLKNESQWKIFPLIIMRHVFQRFSKFKSILEIFRVARFLNTLYNSY
jgi:hypothetical protein